jgi:hypothetical protein
MAPAKGASKAKKQTAAARRKAAAEAAVAAGQRAAANAEEAATSPTAGEEEETEEQGEGSAAQKRPAVDSTGQTPTRKRQQQGDLIALDALVQAAVQAALAEKDTHRAPNTEHAQRNAPIEVPDSEADHPDAELRFRRGSSELDRADSGNRGKTDDPFEDVDPQIRISVQYSMSAVPLKATIKARYERSVSAVVTSFELNRIFKEAVEEVRGQFQSTYPGQNISRSVPPPPQGSVAWP